MSKIIQGDCLTSLKQIQAASVQTCITSPPYWGLRDYGVEGQLGLEETPMAFVTKMVSVFREVHRVLKDDGTLWVNIGDTYATSTKGGLKCKKGDKQHTNVGSDLKHLKHLKHLVKEKDLIGIPWLLAFALRDDGWYLRQEIIWSKPNPMPESVKDRFTKSHEQIFLFSKSKDYYFDQEATLEPCSPNTHARLSQDVQNQIGSTRANGGKAKLMKAVGRKYDIAAGNRNNPSFDSAMAIMPEKRNKRSVWTVSTKGFSEAHFATYPPELIKDCVLAGSRPGDTVLDPFFGAGTTGLVAQENERKYIGIELNPEYINIAKKRLSGSLFSFAAGG